MHFRAAYAIKARPDEGAQEGDTMAQRCEICGKGPITGHRISHAHNLTKRRWIPNLQRVKVMRKGKKTTITVCSSCMKAGKVDSMKSS